MASRQCQLSIYVNLPYVRTRCAPGPEASIVKPCARRSSQSVPQLAKKGTWRSRGLAKDFHGKVARDLTSYLPLPQLHVLLQAQPSAIVLFGVCDCELSL